MNVHNHFLSSREGFPRDPGPNGARRWNTNRVLDHRDGSDDTTDASGHMILNQKRYHGSLVDTRASQNCVSSTGFTSTVKWPTKSTRYGWQRHYLNRLRLVGQVSAMPSIEEPDRDILMNLPSLCEHSWEFCEEVRSTRQSGIPFQAPRAINSFCLPFDRSHLLLF